MLILQRHVCGLRVIFSLRKHLPVVVVLYIGVNVLLPQMDVFGAHTVVFFYSEVGVVPVVENLIDVEVHRVINLRDANLVLIF